MSNPTQLVSRIMALHDQEDIIKVIKYIAQTEQLSQDQIEVTADRENNLLNINSPGNLADTQWFGTPLVHEFLAGADQWILDLLFYHRATRALNAIAELRGGTITVGVPSIPPAHDQLWSAVIDQEVQFTFVVFNGSCVKHITTEKKGGNLLECGAQKAEVIA